MKESISNPCVKCTDREVGCHSVCERYKSWRDFIDERNETIRREKAKEWVTTINWFNNTMKKDR